jgi:DnaJ domain
MMGRDMNPYRLLGVSPGCTLEEVKQAYRTKARRAHPDLGGDAIAFIEVSEAYKQILDELVQRRASRGGTPAHSQTPDSSLHDHDSGTPSNPPSARQAHDQNRAPRPADPQWNPDLILQDRPIWVGHPGRPPDPDWEPEFILLDEIPDEAGESPARPDSAVSPNSFSPSGSTNPIRSVRRWSTMSNQELALGIALLLCMVAIVVVALTQIVWPGAQEAAP